MSRQIAVTVELVPSEGQGEGVMALVRSAFDRIRRERSDALTLLIHTSPDSDRILLYELWQDQDAFEEFLEEPAMAAYLKDLDGRLASRRLNRWTPTA